MNARPTPELVERLSTPVPRYTSYPTAPHFTAKSEDDYKACLSALAPNSTISLYVHIPFCDTLCWFCGCHTKHTLKYAPVSAYLSTLYKEIKAVADLVPNHVEVRNIHWGGGSPTILSAPDIRELSRLINTHFPIARDAEFCVEIDPRELTDQQIEALSDSGLTRASIGVQDFNEAVQEAINRKQSYTETANVVAALRSNGVKSINLDLLYGLPHQTQKSIADTVAKIVTLSPDRVSMFGYAHVPWMKNHQKMIKTADLPDIQERFNQSQKAAHALMVSGYAAIGMDHFAKPQDELAIAQSEGTLRRNFQGYTTDACDALIGFGASAIGELPQGYMQNAVSTGEYIRQVKQTGLATIKGITLDAEDRMRAYVIERLMCDFEISFNAVTTKFGAASKNIIAEAKILAENDEDGLCSIQGEKLCVSEKGQAFIRSICAHFDSYLNKGKAKYSIAV